MSVSVENVTEIDFGKLANLTRQRVEEARAMGLESFYANGDQLIVEEPGASPTWLQDRARLVQREWLKALRRDSSAESRRRAFQMGGSAQSDIFFGVLVLDGDEIPVRAWA